MARIDPSKTRDELISEMRPELLDAIRESECEDVPDNSLHSTELLLRARAAIHAVEVADDPGIRAFREEVIGSKLLEPEKIAAWLKQQEREQVEHDKRGRGYTVVRSTNVWVDPITDRLVLIQEEEPLRLLVRASRNIEEFVEFVKSGKDPFTTVKVLMTGVLGRLLALTKRIAEKCCWTEEETAGWILTGCLPRPLAVNQRCNFGPNVEPNGHSRWARVVLNIAPETPPNAIRSHYRIIRETTPSLTGIPLPGSKGPPLGEKQLQLAAFAAEHNDGRTWRSLLEAWNESVEADWVYGSHRNFARDARDTHLRLVNKPLKWQGSRKKSKESKEVVGDGET